MVCTFRVLKCTEPYFFNLIFINDNIFLPSYHPISTAGLLTLILSLLFPPPLLPDLSSHMTYIHYSLFTYFGSSNFFWFLPHNESLWRNCFVQLMSCTSTFWKCVWFENMGSITKVMNMEVKNVPWRFCPFLHLESSDGVSVKLLPISTLSYSRTGCCSPSTFYALSHSLSKCWHAFCHARGWQTNDISHAAFTQACWNGAKIMAPRWRHDRAKSFLCE